MGKPSAAIFFLPAWTSVAKTLAKESLSESSSSETTFVVVSKLAFTIISSFKTAAGLPAIFAQHRLYRLPLRDASEAGTDEGEKNYDLHLGRKDLRGATHLKESPEPGYSGCRYRCPQGAVAAWSV